MAISAIAESVTFCNICRLCSAVFRRWRLDRLEIDKDGWLDKFYFLDICLCFFDNRGVVSFSPFPRFRIGLWRSHGNSRFLSPSTDDPVISQREFILQKASWSIIHPLDCFNLPNRDILWKYPPILNDFSSLAQWNRSLRQLQKVAHKGGRWELLKCFSDRRRTVCERPRSDQVTLHQELRTLRIWRTRNGERKNAWEKLQWLHFQVESHSLQRKEEETCMEIFAQKFTFNPSPVPRLLGFTLSVALLLYDMPFFPSTDALLKLADDSKAIKAADPY